METVPAKTIVTRTKSTSWFGTDYNMNIYRGCCHGCVYCDSRSECYGIEDFDRVRVKENALEIIRNDLRRKVKPGVVGTGSMSDPYNPLESGYQLTRHALELLNAYGFGAAIATKSALIARDIDVLTDIRSHSPVLCKLTITTCDPRLAEKIEPNVSGPSERLKAVEQLAKAGLTAGILLMPVLPFLEDTPENVREVVRRAAESGARFVYPAFGMTLRQNQRDWYYAKLEKAFPGEELPERYRRQYGNAYRCTSPREAELWKEFTAECRETGLLYHMQDIIRLYRQGYEASQLSLF